MPHMLSGGPTSWTTRFCLLIAIASQTLSSFVLHSNHPLRSSFVSSRSTRLENTTQRRSTGRCRMIDQPTQVSGVPNFQSKTEEKEKNGSRSGVATKGDDLLPCGSPPLFTMGVIADIQYANIPDGHSYSGVPRYYRHALETARHAAKHFEQDSVSLMLNLGDIVDGKCQDIEEHGGDKLTDGVDPGHAAVDDVIDALSSYQSGPVIHTYGNHELYNLDRQDIGKKLGIPFVKEPCGDLVGYRCVSYKNVRFVVLDTYDLALMRRCPQSSRKHKEATKIMSQNNHNFPQEENSPEGLDGLQKRFVAFNGAIDKPQLTWLSETLQHARQAGEKVIVVSHQPILPGSCSPVCLVWNYEELLDVLREYSDTVVASFAGHAHRGGYKRDDDSGIHFRVFEAALENPHPHKTYAFVDVFEDHLVVRGYGNCKSAVYDFDHTTAPATRSKIMQNAPA